MIFAETLFTALENARADNGGTLPRVLWIATVQKLFDQATCRKKARSETPISRMTEEEFIKFLEDSPVLIGVDVRKEIGKCQFWCKANGEQMTRKRIINWMKSPKIEQAVAKSFAGESSRNAAPPDVYTEPQGWQDAARRKFGAGVAELMIAKGWRDICVVYGRDILNELGRSGR